MKALARFAAAGLVLSLAAKSATAQLVNNPTYFTPNAGTGLTLNGEWGAGVNDNSGKLNSFNVRGELGMPMINIGAGFGSYDNGFGGRTLNFEGNAGLTLMSLPLTGVSVSAHAAVGYLSSNGANVLTVPLGITLGVKPPSPGVSLEPWVSARIEIIKPSVGTSTTGVGGSAGVNIGLPMGLGLHAALDMLNANSVTGIVAGLGVHYTFSVPGLGIVPGT